jgi:hypothetical protein
VLVDVGVGVRQCECECAECGWGKGARKWPCTSSVGVAAMRVPGVRTIQVRSMNTYGISEELILEMRLKL